ncbi:MAG: polysaccharide deacetylase family protein [Prevotella sp.]|nr:polysaccharide deacetylase family protein [Prevotella sp.]
MFIEQPAKWLRWIYPHATWRMDRNDHSVYLTFDDGPIPEATPFILDTLAKYGIKATFFMVGDNVKKYPELFERIVNEGHQVGNHTHNHLGSFKHWTATYLVNVHKAQRIMERRDPKRLQNASSFHTFKDSNRLPLFRPPHGWMRWSVYYWLSKEFRVVMWDLVTRDYSKWMTSEGVVNNVKRYARNGSIITFHDSRKSIDKLKTALPFSIEWLRNQGYEFKVFE